MTEQRGSTKHDDTREEFDLSLDIESLAQPSNDSSRKLVMVLSIAGVLFKHNEVNSFEELMGVESSENFPSTQILTERQFYAPVSLAQSLQNGFDLDPNTVAFWEKNARDEKSYNMLAYAAECTEPMHATFSRFAAFLQKYKIRRIWAKSPSFDCNIMREAFNRMNIVLPINWWLERDIRTLMELSDQQVPFPENFIMHHAVHDAAYEAMQVQAHYKAKRDLQDRLSLLDFYESQHTFDLTGSETERKNPTIRWPVKNAEGVWEWAYPAPKKQAKVTGTKRK